MSLASYPAGPLVFWATKASFRQQMCGAFRAVEDIFFDCSIAETA